MQLLQPHGNLVQEMIPVFISVAVIDTAKLMNRNYNYLKMLMPSQAKLQLLVKAFTAAAGSQRILLHPPALKVYKKYDIGSDNNPSVKQNVRI